MLRTLSAAQIERGDLGLTGSISHKSVSKKVEYLQSKIVQDAVLDEKLWLVVAQLSTHHITSSDVFLADIHIVWYLLLFLFS